MQRWSFTRWMVAVAALVAFAAPVAAHGGTLGGIARESLAIPSWLFLSTGGAVVAVSFLLVSVVTDRAFVRALHDANRELPVPASVVEPGKRLLGVLGVGALVVVIVSAFTGPATPVQNLAVVVVWVAWWAGFPMLVYLGGNLWPTVDPWRTIAGTLPALDRTYPARLGAWPAVVGLLALVWVEVVSPVADDPRLLGGLVVAYTVVTLAGAVRYGPTTWFSSVDPVARVFDAYGRVSPVTRTENGFRVCWPGARLHEPPHDIVPGTDAFVLALLWVTTFDGLVATPAVAALTGSVIEAGVPRLLAYATWIAIGYGAFYGAYRGAARVASRSVDTFLTADALAVRFAPPLLAIAVGYHLAHFLGYLLAGAPVLLVVLTHPFAVPPATDFLTLPGWFGGVGIAFVLAGHLLAVWVAHASAFAVFPSRHAAIRSQYPFTAVMVLYTMTSLWVITQPAVALP